MDVDAAVGEAGKVLQVIPHFVTSVYVDACIDDGESIWLCSLIAWNGCGSVDYKFEWIMRFSSVYRFVNYILVGQKHDNLINPYDILIPLC